MRIRKRFSSQAITILCLLALCGGAVAAFANRESLSATKVNLKPNVKVVLSGLVEREGKRVPLDKAGLVNQGEILDWTITSNNEGDGVARNYRTVGQIPEGTVLINGSAKAEGNNRVVYSIDKGKSFSEQPTIEEKQADGSVKRVPAPVSMYTHISYEWTDELAAGSKLSASYKVRVK
jgi:uncharacterized repeat protein (TIGR01451 family)